MNNSTALPTTWENPIIRSHLFSISIAIAVTVPVLLLNVFTTATMMISRKLRKPSNYPITSFLFGSVLQSMFVLPIYTYVQLRNEYGYEKRWICDVYRYPYFFTQHISKVSLMVLGYDRLISIEHPFRYREIITRVLMTNILLVAWVSTLVVDMIPFFLTIETNQGNCTYTPTHNWGVSVIILYDIIPFVAITVNYIFIWLKALSIEKKDRMRHITTQSSNSQSSVETKPRTSTQLSVMSNQGGGGEPKFTGGVLNTVYESEEIYEIKNEIASHDNSSSKDKNNDISVSYHYVKGNREENGKDQTASKYQRSNDLTLRFAWQMKATKTSVLICLAYLVCWGPMGIFYMVNNLCSGCLILKFANKDMYTVRRVVKIISLCSSVVLPLVYCWRSKEFRVEVKRFCCKKLYRKHRTKEINRVARSDLNTQRTHRRQANGTKT